MSSVEATGKSVDEAIESALEKLEEARENVEVEVLEEGSRGVWGVGAQEARVRVTVRENFAGSARRVTNELLQRMGITARVTVRGTGDPVMLDVAGEDLGILIGWRGETLRQFQTVVNLVANEGKPDRKKVLVDIEHYRRRREETIKEMALRLAQRAKRTGEKVTMDAMHAYERRIVHLALEHEPGVTTASTGAEPDRRVVISPEAPGAAPRPAN
jgi:spoIIIJ-associated protein